jgi:hypothetical protein
MLATEIAYVEKWQPFHKAGHLMSQNGTWWTCRHSPSLSALVMERVFDLFKNLWRPPSSGSSRAYSGRRHWGRIVGIEGIGPINSTSTFHRAWAHCSARSINKTPPGRPSENWVFVDLIFRRAILAGPKMTLCSGSHIWPQVGHMISLNWLIDVEGFWLH